MAVGLSATVANSFLDNFRNNAVAAKTAVYLKLHTGDPGAAAANNASAVTTRNAITFSAASAGSMALSSVGSFAMTTSETITHFSIWDASTAGNFLQSGAWTASVPVINGSTFTVSSLTLSFSPVAA